MAGLATLDQLKTTLKITSNDYDTQLQLILDAMCQAILCYTGPLEQASVVGEVHDGKITDTIVVENNPIVSVERVAFECGKSGSTRELTSDEYYFDDCSIMLKCEFTPRGRGVVLVDYTHGYATVPPDVILAHIEASKIYFQYTSNNQEHLQSVRKKDEQQTNGASQGSLFSSESGLPFSVEAKLQKYRDYCWPNAGMAQRNR